MSDISSSCFCGLATDNLTLPPEADDRMQTALLESVGIWHWYLKLAIAGHSAIFHSSCCCLVSVPSCKIDECCFSRIDDAIRQADVHIVVCSQAQ